MKRKNFLRIFWFTGMEECIILTKKKESPEIDPAYHPEYIKKQKGKNRKQKGEEQDEKQIQKTGSLCSDSCDAVAAVWRDHAGRGGTDTGGDADTDTGRDACTGDAGSTDGDIRTGDTGSADRDVRTGDTGSTDGDVRTGDTGSADGDIRTGDTGSTDRDRKGYRKRDGKEKEKETEASDRVNDGKKIEESTVTSRLGSVRTKLFAADSVILPDTLKEQVGADWILDGTDGKAAVDGLSGLSKTLANGQSTSKVEVINL